MPSRSTAASFETGRSARPATQRCRSSVALGSAVRCLHRSAELLDMSRFCFVLLLTTMVFAVPNYAQAAEANVRQGRVNVVLPQLRSLSSASRGENFNGCGRGRVRDPKTNQCRGPADISRQPQSYALFCDRDAHPWGGGSARERQRIVCPARPTRKTTHSVRTGNANACRIRKQDRGHGYTPGSQYTGSQT